MANIRAWFSRLAGFLHGRNGDRELTAELDANLQAHIDDNLRAGMTYDEARRQAALMFGGMEIAKDTYREQRGLPWLENVARDLRHAFQRLRRSPAFAGAALAFLTFFCLA